MKWLDAIRDLARTMRAKPDNSRVYFHGGTQAGLGVDYDVAQNYAAVWACVRVISETVAQLPWKVYQRTARGKKEAANHTVNWLLHVQPNPETTAFRFKRAQMHNVLLWGNAYAEIERDGSGRPVWIWPVHPSRVKVERDDAGELRYRVAGAREGGPEAVVPARDMLHVRGIGDDDIVGTSVIAKAKQSIGLGLAMERYGSSFFGNGTHMGGVLYHPGKLSPEARANLENSLKSRASRENSLKSLVLEEGMKYDKLGTPPEDAQFLESRSFQVLEIARWFRVPPHKLFDLSRATWNNIEQMAIEFVTDTIVPWTCNLEEEANIKLFGRQQYGVYYSKFMLQALLRGDTKSRYDAYAVGRQWGWLSQNDVRELEDMNPIPNGNQYLVPSNMTTPKKLEEASPPGTAPAKADPTATDPAIEDPGMDPNTPTDGVRAARILNKART